MTARLPADPHLRTLCGVLALAVALWLAWSLTRDGLGDHWVNARVEGLIEELHRPENKTDAGLYVVPGGEVLSFSPPMQQLLALGDKARDPLHRHLGDPDIQNEVVVILGAVGDESTVPLLIQAYPQVDVSGEKTGASEASPARLKVMCFTFALTYLTGQDIGRSRWGADCDPDNRKRWQAWWATHRKTFWVSEDKPPASWVPSYPATVGPIRDRKRPEDMVPVLVAALRDDDAGVRRAAAEALWWIGPEAEACVAALIDALRDPDEEVRCCAAYALLRIGPGAKAAVPALVRILAGDRLRVRDLAAYALWGIGEAAVPAVLQVLKEGDAKARALAAWALANFNPKPRGALPALLRASKDHIAEVRCHAIGSLRVIAPDSPEVFRTLRAGLRDKAAAVRSIAAYSLEALGPGARGVAGDLARLLRDPDPGVRTAAADALSKVGPLRTEVARALSRALEDQTWEVRASVCCALARAGPEARTAVPALIKALKDDSEVTRREAAEALKKIDPKAAAKAGIW